MARFLRDEFIKNVTITEETLCLVDEFLSERETTINDELDRIQAKSEERLVLTYIIRFDGRGYKLDDFEEVKKYYAQANNVERVIFILDSEVSERTAKQYGTHFELKLDNKEQNNTYIQVASDDGDAVDTAFCGLKDIIGNCSNKNWIVRSTWSQLLVQIFGVVFGFVLSLIAGLKISPHLNIENSFVITFIFAFLIFSNAWGFINQQILRFLDYSFPNISFSRKGKNVLHWLTQTLVGGIIVALTLLIISKAFEWVGKILGEYISK